MSPDLSDANVSSLARDCAAQSARFHSGEPSDPCFCFELFRRALRDQDEFAWRCIYQQYTPLVTGWVKRHGSYPSSGEEPQYFVNRAFERMWLAVAPEFPFVKLAQVLRYLQMCVHSVILDYVRAAEHATIRAQSELPETLAQRSVSIEGQVTEEMAASDLLRAVFERLNDDRERTVVYAAFVLGLKPREICAWRPAQFADVTEVYRIKENVLARLKRDESLKLVLGHA